MNDSIAPLRAALRGKYEIEREIGQGAFARVYLARDLKHERRVAIKILVADPTTASAELRFIREIRVLARLQHPNILPLHDSGHVESLLYYVTPYVSGETLRAWLERERQLSVETARGIALEVSDALACAHEQGIIHRDIKPENILLSAGHAMVADFGIARLIDVAGVQQLTVTGLGGPGTPAYMSPEQLLGEKAPDARSDIYSLGCVLYEMLTGKAPFMGKEGFARRFTEAAPLVSATRRDVPPWLNGCVARALARDPNDRYGSARELRAALAEGNGPAAVVRPHRDADASGKRRWSLPSVSPGVRRGVLIGVPALALIVMVGLAWARARAAKGERGVTSVAVLPFTNPGGDSSQTYLAEGMSDGLTTALGKLRGVRIVSRTLSAHYRGQREIDPREIRRNLGADYVVNASVRRVGAKLRVSAQLINAADNEEVWSETYDREAAEAYAVQDSITRAVASALTPQLVPSERPGSRSHRELSSGTSNPDAYDLYLRGRYLLARRGPGVAQAVERFQQAIDIDPTFAAAHAGLGFALELLPYFSSVRAATIRARAMEAARRALSLDSAQAEAHTALALANAHAYQWSAARKEHQLAVAIDPNDANSLTQYGRFLHYTGQLADAREQFRRARLADPYDAVASGWLGHLTCLMNRHREAVIELDRALEIDSDSAPPVLFMAVQANLLAGDTTRAARFLQRLWERTPAWRGSAGLLYADLGNRAKALSVARELELNPDRFSVGVATASIIHSALGDTARALDLLERATDAGDIWPTSYSLSEREVDPLRRSERFAAIVRRVGLDERIFTAPNGGRPQ